jgi:hypothetical protein
MNRFAGGQPHGVIYSVGEMQESASAILLAKDMADYLENKHYPGWGWGVSVDPRGGVVTLVAMKIRSDWGVVLKLDWIQNSPGARRRHAISAGAEILERFGVKPGPYSYEAWRSIPLGVDGLPKPDLSDKHQRIKRFSRDEALTNAVKNGSVTIKHQDRGGHRRIIVVGGYRKRDEENAQHRRP